MSWSIQGTDITLTRGDYMPLKIKMKTKDGKDFIPPQGSSIRFAMKARYSDPDEKVVINKQIPINTMTLEIIPEDTKSLPMKKEYVYDIQYTDQLGHPYTFLFGKFLIGEEVL